MKLSRGSRLELGAPRSKMAIRRRRILPLALVVAFIASAALAGCSADSKNTSSGKAEKSFDIIMVTHFAASEPTGSLIVNGFDNALDTLGLTGKQRGPDSGNETNAATLTRLIEQAIASKPDGLVVTDPFPDGMNAAIKKATDQGIPVVIINAGAGQSDKTGALTTIVTSDQQLGAQGGQGLREAGSSHPLLISLTPGIPLADDRTAGFESAYPDGAVNTLRIPVDSLNNPTAVTNAIAAAFAKDPDIDGVFSIGSAFNVSMIAAQSELGDKASSIKWASIDLGPQVVSALQNGKMAFALDQQAYMQGYEAVQILSFYLRYGITPGSRETEAAPAAVTPDNIGSYTDAVKAGVRG